MNALDQARLDANLDMHKRELIEKAQTIGPEYAAVFELGLVTGMKLYRWAMVEREKTVGGME